MANIFLRQNSQYLDNIFAKKLKNIDTLNIILSKANDFVGFEWGPTIFHVDFS